MAEKGIGLREREELNKLDRAAASPNLSLAWSLARSTRKWELGPLARSLPRRIFCTPSCDVTIPNATVFIWGFRPWLG